MSTATAPFTFERPAWARGTVMVEDARFLHDLVIDTRPLIVIEVGVASGCSSVVLLKALAQVHGADADRWCLHAYDVADRCYFDASHPTGAAVAEFAPHLLSHYRLTQGDARTARQHVGAGSVRFAFVDANHFHPWPVLDLLALLPTLAPGAWVALHDVRLPRLQARSLRGHGPAYLFDAWPFEKRSGGYHGNTGAIRIPEGCTDLDAVWTRALDQPWECLPSPEVLEALGVAPRPVAVREMRALRAVERAIRDERPLCVWGTGQAARTLAASLATRGVALHALVDRDEARRRTPLDGLPVLAPNDVRAMRGEPALVLVTGMYRTPIARQLTAEGWRRDVDFVVL
jgi:predicted O-methyltransferase YrrM